MQYFASSWFDFNLFASASFKSKYILKMGDGRMIEFSVENEDNLSNVKYDFVHSFKHLALHRVREWGHIDKLSRIPNLKLSNIYLNRCFICEFETTK